MKKNDYLIIDNTYRYKGIPEIDPTTNEIKNREAGVCNNFGYRLQVDKKVPINIEDVSCIVEHHTGDMKRTISAFTDGKVSAHYVVPQSFIPSEKDALSGSDVRKVYEFVGPEYRAWHAGAGELSKKNCIDPDGKIEKNNINSHSIGIEHINNVYEPYPSWQIESTVLLHDKICKEYKINPKNLCTHAMWALGRKFDVGYQFPWEELYYAGENPKYQDFGIERGFGVFPSRETQETISKIDIASNITKLPPEDIFCIKAELREFGYNVDDTDKVDQTTIYAIGDFNGRFCRKVFLDHPELQKSYATMILTKDQEINAGEAERL